MNDEELKISQSETSPKKITVRFSDIWKGIIKFWWLVVILGLLGGGAFYYRDYRSYHKIYSVSATFTVNTQARSLTGEGLPSYSYAYDNATASQLEDTFPYILSSNILTEAICEDLNMSYVPASLTASVVSQTNMFTLTSTGADAQLTYDVLMSAMENYPNAAKFLVGNVKLTVITEPQVPTEPINSFSYSSISKGMVIGIFLGVVWIAIYAIFRKTIKTKEDIRSELKLSVLGTVPEVTFKKYKKQDFDKSIHIKNDKIGNGFLEAVRIMKNSLRNQLAENEKVIMVTSTAPGEGKTTIAVNIAAALADDGCSVLVVDCDLRNPSVSEMLGIRRKVVEDDFDDDDKIEIPDASFYEIDEKIDLGISYLNFNVNSGSYWKIMNVQYLRGLMKEMRSKYDYIVVDTPPCGLVSDSITIAQVCDVLAYVMLQDTVRTNKILGAIDLLISTDIKILGGVLNGAQSGLAGYGNDYGYGYARYSHYKYYSKYGYGYGYGYGSKYGYGESKSHHKTYFKKRNKSEKSDKKSGKKSLKEKKSDNG